MCRATERPLATGMGRQTALQLAEKGWKVAIIDYNEMCGNEIANEIAGSFYKADVRSWKQQFYAFEQIQAKYGRIDFGMYRIGCKSRWHLVTS